MNIVQFKGGLGNQMFQYALYRALNLAGNSKVLVNIGYYLEHPEERCFELSRVFHSVCLRNDYGNQMLKKKNLYMKLRRNRNWIAYINYAVLPLCIYFKEKESGVYDERVYKLKNAVISGYWQTEKYFKNIRGILLKDFTFQYGEDNLVMLRNKLLQNNSSVGIHIRRGDYLKSEGIYGNLSESLYYRRAIDYISKKIQAPQLIFFSDDMETVRRKYPYENAVYIDSSMFEKYQSWYDMYLMSSCSHNIIANSSFSWWGAWLNQNRNKIVIAPEKWFFDGQRGEDICPDEWKKIEVN